MIDIFYVEDDETISGSLKEYFGQKGYKVSAFSTIASAKEALLSMCPTLVLVDWNMPDGNGSLFVRWIRSKWKEWGCVKTIYILRPYITGPEKNVSFMGYGGSFVYQSVCCFNYCHVSFSYYTFMLASKRNHPYQNVD